MDFGPLEFARCLSPPQAKRTVAQLGQSVGEGVKRFCVPGPSVCPTFDDVLNKWIHAAAHRPRNWRPESRLLALDAGKRVAGIPELTPQHSIFLDELFREYQDC